LSGNNDYDHWTADSGPDDDLEGEAWKDGNGSD
jgi:hypothetical protein